MNGDQIFWRDFTHARQDEYCRDLAHLLSLDTVSGATDPAGDAHWRRRTAEGFDYLHDLARRLGFVTRLYEHRVLVVERPGPAGSPVLGFPIHLDVVPAGEGWTRNPFGGEISAGAIWGRGAQDDKGPIIQCLYGLLGAGELAARSDRGFRKTVRVIVVSEEECGVWDDIPYYFQREAPPDFSIVPDAWFPITNGEKGFVNVEVEFRWTPGLGADFLLESGERSNVVPARAWLRAGRNLLNGRFDPASVAGCAAGAPKPPEAEESEAGIAALFHGTGAHGSTPGEGHNAAADALAAASALPALRAHPAGRALAWLAEAARDWRGGFLGIAASHPKVGETTVNLGVLRADGEGAKAVLNIRTPIGLSTEEAARRVREAALRLGDETSGLIAIRAEAGPGAREPIYVDPDQFAAWIEPMKTAYTAATGRAAGLMTIGGTTFAKAFPNAVCFGPVDPAEPGEDELAHKADEHVTLAAMRRNIEIYGRAIAGIALEG